MRGVGQSLMLRCRNGKTMRRTAPRTTPIISRAISTKSKWVSDAEVSGRQTKRSYNAAIRPLVRCTGGDGHRQQKEGEPGRQANCPKNVQVHEDSFRLGPETIPSLTHGKCLPRAPLVKPQHPNQRAAEQRGRKRPISTISKLSSTHRPGAARQACRMNLHSPHSVSPSPSVITHFAKPLAHRRRDPNRHQKRHIRQISKNHPIPDV